MGTMKQPQISFLMLCWEDQGGVGTTTTQTFWPVKFNTGRTSVLPVTVIESTWLKQKGEASSFWVLNSTLQVL